MLAYCGLYTSAVVDGWYICTGKVRVRLDRGWVWVCIVDEYSHGVHLVQMNPPSLNASLYVYVYNHSLQTGKVVCRCALCRRLTVQLKLAPLTLHAIPFTTADIVLCVRGVPCGCNL